MEIVRANGLINLIDLTLGTIGFTESTNITSSALRSFNNFTDDARTCFGDKYHGGPNSGGNGCELKRNYDLTSLKL